VDPPGVGKTVAAYGCEGNQEQRKEVLQVGVEVVEPGGEGGEVGGEVGLRPAGEEDAGEGREVFRGHEGTPF
jgi:hypothetical protein